MSRNESDKSGATIQARATLRKSIAAMFVALAAVGGLSLARPAPAQAQGISISISLFHERLAQHGRWFEHPRYGWAWFPTTVDRQWRPYSRGQWVWTEEYGWYWNSDEPFGWATYHYGRWGYDEVYGWVWVPGNTWGPAWVAFRYGDARVGWAPLPPETLSVSVGFDVGYTDMSASYYAPRWVFVPRNRFLDRRVYTYAAAPTRNSTYIRQTTNVTNYVTVNNVVVNRSIDRQRIETALGRRIVPVRVRDVDDVRQAARRSDREIGAYRPQVQAARDAAPPAAARARPTDRPRYAVRPDAVAPSERRNAPDGQRATTPTQPPSTSRTTPDERRGATPTQKPAERRAIPEERRGATPAQPPSAPRAAPEERRGAIPAQPPSAPRAAPGEQRGTTPAQPPSAPRAAPEERRGAIPAQPPSAPRAAPGEQRGATPAQPPSAPRAAPEERRGATPAQPPAVTRGAPDQQRGDATPAQPRGRSAPQGGPPQSGDDEPKKGERQSR